MAEHHLGKAGDEWLWRELAGAPPLEIAEVVIKWRSGSKASEREHDAWQRVNAVGDVAAGEIEIMLEGFVVPRTRAGPVLAEKGALQQSLLIMPGRKTYAVTCGEQDVRSFWSPHKARKLLFRGCAR
jgi:hypothetical protein